MSGTNGATLAASAQLAAGAAQANSEYQSGRYNQRLFKINAALDEEQAKQAELRAGHAVNRVRSEGRRVVAAQRAAYAGQGVRVDTGVAADVVADTEAAVEQDVETVRLNAALEAFGHRVSAYDNRNKAKLEKAESRNKAAGSLLTAAGTATETYRRTKYPKD